jgi:hypothetical protein
VNQEFPKGNAIFYTLIREDEKVRVMEIIAQLMIMTLGDHRFFLALILLLLSHEDKRGHRAQCSSFLMNIANGDKSCFHDSFIPKRNDQACNAITLQLQRRRHCMEKLWEQFSGTLKGAYWLISCPERKLSM